MYYIAEVKKIKADFLGYEKGEKIRRIINTITRFNKLNINYYNNKATARRMIQQLKKHDKQTNARKLWAIRYQIKKANNGGKRC